MAFKGKHCLPLTLEAYIDPWRADPAWSPQHWSELSPRCRSSDRRRPPCQGWRAVPGLVRNRWSSGPSHAWTRLLSSHWSDLSRYCPLIGQICPDTVLSLVRTCPDTVLSLVRICPDTVLSLVRPVQILSSHWLTKLRH